MIDINREQPEENELPESIRPVGTRDTRLIERAIREGWPIPEKYREAVVRRQIAIAVSKKSKPREATSAAKALTAMDKQNCENARLALEIEGVIGAKSQPATSITNQQVNIYLPANGRETRTIEHTNGHNGNGKH